MLVFLLRFNINIVECKYQIDRLLNLYYRSFNINIVECKYI